MLRNLRSLILAALFLGCGIALSGCAGDETVQPANVEPAPTKTGAVDEPASTDEQP